MNYLLDTGVFLQALAAPAKLNHRAQELISGGRDTLCLSAATAWEISTKYALGKLRLPEPPTRFIQKYMQEWRLNSLDMTHTHALAAGELPWLHKDPFDRLLIAQARVEQMVVMTADRMFEEYDVQVLWCGR